jgi:hypothetical protein
MTYELNPCDRLITCDLSCDFHTAAGLTWLYTEHKFWSMFLGFPRALPIELKGIAV